MTLRRGGPAVRRGAVGIGGYTVGAFHALGMLVIDTGAPVAVRLCGAHRQHRQRQHTDNDEVNVKSSHRSLHWILSRASTVRNPPAVRQADQAKSELTLP